MYGLIDCNNFFVSCERIFRPDVVNKPVVVMSNNDGCAVAMSNEAKALGISRGIPVYQVKQIIKQHNVITFSGNHKLYGDISSRVMATIGQIVPDYEIYSIDEAFLNFAIWNQSEIKDIGHKIVRKIRRDVGVPTSLGIAQTKTLAKIAAKFAKNYPAYNCVCMIDTDEKRQKALRLTNIEDVWGIGRRTSKRLKERGIHTALQFAELPRTTVVELLNVCGERTWRELNGEPCNDFELIEPDRKQICTTRSFSNAFDDIENLREAITYFCDNIARKLRKQRGCARTLTVFIQTNSFRTDMPQHYGTQTVTLDEATDDTIILNATATRLLYSIYKTGYSYKRAGVIVTDIVSRNAVQQNLFANHDVRIRRRRLMDTIDKLNRNESSYNKVHLATQTPINQRVRQEELSPYYTTRLSDIIEVKTV